MFNFFKRKKEQPDNNLLEIKNKDTVKTSSPKPMPKPNMQAVKELLVA